MTIPILILALLPIGQYRACTTATSYGHVQTYATQTYAPTHAAYVEKDILVGNLPDPYYAGIVGDRMKAELAAEKRQQTEEALQQRVGSLNETVARLEARLAQFAAQPVPAPQPVAVPPPPTPNPPPGPSVSASAAPSDVEVAATSILKANCLKCHSGKASGGGGFVIFDDKGALADIHPLDKLRLDAAVYSGEMPPGKPPLSPEDYSTLRAWIAESDDEINTALRVCRNKTTQR